MQVNHSIAHYLERLIHTVQTQHGRKKGPHAIANGPKWQTPGDLHVQHKGLMWGPFNGKSKLLKLLFSILNLNPTLFADLIILSIRLIMISKIFIQKSIFNSNPKRERESKLLYPCIDTDAAKRN